MADRRRSSASNAIRTKRAMVPPKKDNSRPGRAFQLRTHYFDYSLLTVVIFLVCFGMVMLYSTSAYTAQVENGDSFFYIKRQGFFTICSFGLMYFISRIDYHRYAKLAKAGYIFSFFFMALVLSPLGIEANQARRWIRVPGGQMQPSEFTKIAVIIFVPYLLCKMGKEAISFKGLFKVLCVGFASAIGVLFLTDNLSTAIIVFCIVVGMAFVVYPKMKPFVIAGGGGLLLVGALVAYVGATMETSTNFRLRRILSWLHPENYTDSGSFQTTQALYAIGSGGFFGKGLGNSTQKLVIPEAQNDMILSVIAEEMGVMGVIILLILFGILLYRLMFIAQNAPDMFGSLIVTGIFTHIAVQVAFNIAVVTNLFPNTGITLPFISYGGTSVLFLLTEIGIALGISRQIIIPENE